MTLCRKRIGLSASAETPCPIGVRLPLPHLVVNPVCPCGAAQLGDDLVAQTHGERVAVLNPRPDVKGRGIGDVLTHGRIAYG
jgi:hypothetical protein